MRHELARQADCVQIDVRARFVFSFSELFIVVLTSHEH